MKSKTILHFLIGLVLSVSQNLYAQKTDANIIGHVVSEGNHVPFATVAVLGTTLGTATDETGHYQLINLPEGEQTIVVSMVGFKSQERTIYVENNKTEEIKFDLEPDVLNLDEVVVSANRGQQKRTEAPVIVNTISPKLFNTSQSVTLSEVLNFSPGLRLENNCQNCGFTQVRMNGMDGAHSQVLINSRPIFSGLAGVYGLELIPTNMIEKVEVVRGGGSALFGSNAVAGTINILLKDPVTNAFEIGSQYSLVGAGIDGSGGKAPEFSVNANATVVNDDNSTGLSLYGFSRKKEMFDANGDGFSEIAPMRNLTFGARLFHKFGSRDKLAFDYFAIKENRDGGNKQDYPLHEREVAEAVSHDMHVAGVSYERFFRKYDLLTIYGSGQYLDRDSYYGAGYSQRDYGNSKDRTGNIGVHYKAVLPSSSLIVGIENTSSFLIDKKLGYADYENANIQGDSIISVPHVGNTIVSDQSSITTGSFLQYDATWNKFKISVGGRYDVYKITDYATEGAIPKTGQVFSPRVSIMYPLLKELKARVSYSQGYRAPQIFDEDLHIEASNSRKVLHDNDPDLKQETSHSYMASLDFNGLIGTLYSGLLVEGFYTRLMDAFENKKGLPDENGTVVYTRTNTEGGATVQGINVELKLKPLRNFEFSSGYTIQSSKYDTPQEDFNENNFYRTPNQYGYIALDYDFIKNLCLSATGNYTGRMLVPYYGPNTDPVNGELRTSQEFFDLSIKASYDIDINGATLQIFGGVKNIFHSYQSDFDIGENRDPAYVYGTNTPRTIYFGIKLGSLL